MDFNNLKRWVQKPEQEKKLNPANSKINLDLDTGLITLLSRTRELAKNNAIVRSYLELMEKNVIGKSGFTLQSQIQTNGKLDKELNEFIEWEYYDWCKAANGFLTIDHSMGRKRT